MRGKHKNAAAHRRDRDELVAEAEEATHRAAKAETELAELTEKSERQIGRLRAELSQALKERDASTAPALDRALKAASANKAKLQELAQELASEKAEQQVDLKRKRAEADRIFSDLAEAFRASGLDLDQYGRVLKHMQGIGRFFFSQADLTAPKFGGPQ